MRRHIAKNMQTRSHALRNGIQAYNTAAAALDPPRPKLEWETVSHYHLLQEFELLNDTRADVRERPWARPAVRETLRQARRVARAREEIDTVNIEARRVHSAIRDEEALFARVLGYVSRVHDPVHGALLEYVTRRRAANAHVLAALQKLFELPDFSGDATPGRRVGGPPASPFDGLLATDAGTTPDAGVESAGTDDPEEEDLEDDDVREELTTLTDFFGSLHT